jgi:hypothetical protein
VDGTHSETFAFLDDLRLEIRASPRSLGHFRAEYGQARATPRPAPDLVISFQSKLGGLPLSFHGRYRSLRWQVEIDPRSNGQIHAAIDLRGAPREFGLSLLQGYVIEPLLALLAPAAGHVLLPAAAVQVGDGVLLLVGRSRSGKSTLVARAAAAGLVVLGDDHVLVGVEGCRSFPRRLRLYSDIVCTAPTAYRSLPLRDRVVLRVLGAVRAATRGAVAPPVRVPIDEIGAVAAMPGSLDRVVMVQRRDGATLSSSELPVEELVGAAIEIIREQRRALETLGDDDWQARLELVRASERSLLTEAFSRARTLTRLETPDRWSATRSVEALAGALGSGF